MAAATLDGHTITVGTLQIPAWGRAWADVEISEAEVLAPGSVVQLVIADASYTMAVVAGGVTDGARARYRLVAGRGGWGRPLPRKGYHNDAGVSATTVILDAADAAGETLGALPTAKLGAHFARLDGAPASAVLHAVVPRAWYVDAAGVTQFGARPPATYEGPGARTRVDPAAGVIELAVDEIGNLAPGVSVDGSPAAVDVEITIDPKRILVRLMFAARGSRRLAAYRRIVAALFPEIRYSGTFEFRVVTQEGNRLNLQPVRALSGMPDLARVPVRPGVSGWRSDVTLGERVLVTFADRDPSRPQVIAHDDPDSPGWLPQLCEFGAGDFLAQKAAVDALQQAFDSHTHPYVDTPIGPAVTLVPATPVGPLPSCEKLKGE